MVESLRNMSLREARPHPAVDRLNLTWNDLRICFERRKMNTQLFQKYFDHIRYWNWSWISEHVALDESFIYLYCRHVNWVKISRHQRLTVDLVAHFETDISWVDLSANPHLTIDILTQFATRLNWGLVCKTIVLREDQITQFQRYIDWYEVSLKSPLKESFIETHKDRVFWPRITAHQVLSDDFIDKHADRVDWDYISRHRPMDRKFIEDHADYVDWGLISDGQELSEQFILDHRLRLDWEEIAYGQKISEEFFEVNAPKTPEVWGAFATGRQLTPDFIARHITLLPTKQLTRFQTFTLDELDTYADYLDWLQLSILHPFTRPGTNEIDEAFIRRHADRFDWPQLVRHHVFSVELLLDFRPRFAAKDIHQKILTAILRRHPELVNREWISDNCPLTLERFREVTEFVLWPRILRRHLSEELVLAYPEELNILMIPISQPPLSTEWITDQARTGRNWAITEELDPRYWPLYMSGINVNRYKRPADEFFRRNQAQLVAQADKLVDGDILLKTMVASIHLLPPAVAADIRLKCAINELNVPSSWDYFEHSRDVDWDWLVSKHRLSEAFLRRFQHKVNWTVVSATQNRPFSERFVRAFQDRLDFTHIQLPYDVTMDFLREYGRRYTWVAVTQNLQEWQMEEYMTYCDFRLPPNNTLTEAFIQRHYPYNLVVTTQPMSEAYMEQHDPDCTWGPWMVQNSKIILSQKFLLAHRTVMTNMRWTRVSNHTIVNGFMSHLRYVVSKAKTEFSPYVRTKFRTMNAPSAPDYIIYNSPAFWIRPSLPEHVIRKYIRNVDWKDISNMQELSPDFIAEFKDKLNWVCMSQNQRMSESTIRRFKDYVIWPLICRYQTLSESFIAEFADRVNWEPLSPFSAYY